MFHLTSTANPRIREVIRLRNNRHRRDSGQFLIDGVRETTRAVACRIEILDIFVTEHFATSECCRSILSRLTDKPTRTWTVSDTVFSKLCYGDRSDGIVAVAMTPSPTFTATTLPQTPLLCVLENIEKPGNVGAVFRSADGAGIDGILLSGRHESPFHSNCIRASLGTVFSVPFTVEAEPMSWLRQRGIKIAAARCDGAIPYTKFDFCQPCAIVLGAESEGLSDRWREPDIAAIQLPMRGVADSLNISAAAAVLFYHATSARNL